MVVAGTGHRPQSLGVAHRGSIIEAKIKAGIVEALTDLKPDVVLSGMALGFDQWLAEVCIEIEIPFDAIVPFQGQERVWKPDQRRHYQYLVARARNTVVVCEGGWANWKMQKRNEYLVDHCDILLAAWDGNPAGGTANCVYYAMSKQRPIRHLSW